MLVALALVVVHLQAVLVPLWVAMRCRGLWLKSGFVYFSLASLAEMVDQTTTDLVYVNHNSFSMVSFMAHSPLTK